MSPSDGTAARAPARRHARRGAPPAGREDLGPVLFITRKFPPAVGGMEAHAAGMAASLGQLATTVDVVALGRSQRHLAWWLPATLLRSGWRLARRAPRHVIVGDALTYAALRPALRRSSATTTVMVHGLDLVFGAPGYKQLVRRTLPSADRVIANSRSTAQLAAATGADPARVLIVHPPVQPVTELSPGRERSADRRRALDALGLPAQARMLLTVGRLVARKGVAWFVANVFPRLDASVRYVVAGGGPQASAVRRAAEQAGVSERVLLLGRVGEDERERLLSSADLFIQPNVAVDHDVEGFGMAVVEATLRGTPVVASRLEGLTDALLDGRAGSLCPPGDAAAFETVITELLGDPEARTQRAAGWQEAARAAFAPQRVAAQLRAALEGA